MNAPQGHVRELSDLARRLGLEGQATRRGIEKFLWMRSDLRAQAKIVLDDNLVNAFLDFLQQQQQMQKKRTALRDVQLNPGGRSLQHAFEASKSEAASAYARNNNNNDNNKSNHTTRRERLVQYVEGRSDGGKLEDLSGAPVAIPGLFGLERHDADAGIAGGSKRKRPAGQRGASLRGGFERTSTSFAVTDETVCADGGYGRWQDLDRLDLANMKIFGNKGFRHEQKKICALALQKHDVFVLMPTGGGKSLCYQLPAAVDRGLAIVISPLLSLINDQVKALIDMDFPATYLSSSQTEKEKKMVFRELKKSLPTCKLLYLTPEQFVKSQHLQSVLRALFDAGLLSRLIVDEAHCISQWGHDFRVDYKNIGSVKKNLFPGLPAMALTATATEDVCKDIMKTLGMDKKKTKFFKVSFNRPNIFWRVLPKNMKNDKDGIPQYVNFIAEYIKTRWLDCSGIIYCLSRDETEETAAYLREEHGLNVGHYHAGMTPKQRNVIQLAWKAGKVPVICATVAFGMGVDNAHVRFVVHQTMPKSVEGYYQESGRAGRDGKPSEALLLYSRRDVGRVKSLIWSGKAKKKSKQIQVDLVDQMKEYCENQFDCRRKLILSYFGETFTKHQCQGSCDNCKCKK